MTPEVRPDQVWRRAGQHYRVLGLEHGVAILQRCTPDGRVLNPRYRPAVPVDTLVAEYELVKKEK